MMYLRPHSSNYQKEPYEFSHFLIFSKTYVQKESDSGDENGPDMVVRPRVKKQKLRVATQLHSSELQDSSIDEDIQYFHPEDELFLKDANHSSFSFTSSMETDEPSFKTAGLLIVMERTQLETSVQELESFLGAED
jgi:hypothetical protein